MGLTFPLPLTAVLALVLPRFFGGAEGAEAVAELPERVVAGMLIEMFSEPAVNISFVPLR